MSEQKPRTVWFSISVFWVYVAGVLLFMVIVGIISSRVVDIIKPTVSVQLTVTATPELSVVQHYRDIVAIDTRTLKQDIGQMSHACDPEAGTQSACLAELALVHNWLIQFRSDLDGAQVPGCYYIVNGQIQGDLAAYLQAEQAVYTGESLQQQGSVAQGLAAFKQTTINLDDTLVTEGAINC